MNVNYKNKMKGKKHQITTDTHSNNNKIHIMMGAKTHRYKKEMEFYGKKNPLIYPHPFLLPPPLLQPRPQPTPPPRPPLNTNNSHKLSHNIRNVYQEKYINTKASGFGDFLRGCFFTLQICKKFNKKCIIDINNHPLSIYIATSNHKKRNEPIYHFSNFNFIPKILDNNIISSEKIKSCESDFMKYINNQEVIDNQISAYITSFPVYNITNDEREFVKNNFIPTNEMSKYVNSTINEIGLKLKEYNIIHIRLGDQYLINNKTFVNNQLLINIFKMCNKYINKDKKYLLLGDNNLIKKTVCNEYKNVFTITNPITHLGENVNYCDIQVKNTMLDFYLMSNSNEIYSMSVYDHGSGFSKWCAEIYNLPYLCTLIE